ncbi:MAG: UDP-glucose--hexose-1-phosphate uridylyltransferase [Bacteroidota bacterium]
MTDLQEHSHRRYNPLTGSWVQVSPHRAKRPWQGAQEKPTQEHRPTYDPTCYLCPGNTRANGEVNPQYTDVYAFTNDFSALQPEVPEGKREEGFFRYHTEAGLCRVICFSPRHDLTIPELDIASIRNVVDLWVEECKTLGKLDYIRHIQIFENKGETMGCSNPHPHGQIWAQATVPEEPAKKQVHQAAYYEQYGRTLLADYWAEEQQAKERWVWENDHMVVLVPFWAVWPYETLLVPKRPMARITEMTPAEKTGLAEAYHQLTLRYDNLFETSFPYSAGIHQAPYDGQAHPEWHWHMSFYPPLLRSATVKKFMVGYEMLANPQRDITAEQSAERLRGLSDVHYKMR